jgi:hypothetical protein
MMPNNITLGGNVSETKRVAPSSFEELIALRTELIYTNKRNGCNFEDILVGLYKDPSHFILEILQNAEDAGASQISFNLTKDYLEIQYDGKPFSLDDVDSITTIGRSTKKGMPDQIGRFGIGFKSVFAVTITPVIESGNFHFQISDFMLPQVLEDSVYPQSVRIKLPFNHPHSDRQPESVYSLIEEKLTSLGASSILFLSNLKDIKWKSLELSGTYSKQLYERKYLGEYQITEVTSEMGAAVTKSYFLVFNKEVQVEQIDREVSIAFGFSANVEGPVDLGQFPISLLHVFFPTSFDTGLPFLIQGPFRTVASREDIQLNDPVNDYLLNELGSLLEETIRGLRNKRYLTLDMLYLLPIEHSKTGNHIYNLLYHRVLSILKDESGFIPIDDEGYSSPTVLAIANKDDLVSLFDREMISEILNKKAWVSRSIAKSNYSLLRDYLVSVIGINQYSMRDMISAFDPAFLGKQSDAWLVGFYRSLKNRHSLWIPANYNTPRGILRATPFVRLTSNSMSEPFDTEENALVYMPRDGHANYKTIKSNLLEDTEVVAFFEKLGIKTPDIFAEIREDVLPRYSKLGTTISAEVHRSDISLIQAATASENQQEWKKLLLQIQRTPIIPVGRSIDGDLEFILPTDAYVPTHELKVYFESCKDINFVQTDVYTGIETGELHRFLTKAGCRFSPMRIQIESQVPPELRKREQDKRSGKWPLDEKIIDYDLHGLEFALESITKEKSVCLWNLLLKMIANCNSYNKGTCLRAKYSFKYHISRSNYVTDQIYYDSQLLNRLKQSAFLFTPSGECVIPNDITSEDLSTNYTLATPEAEILIALLGFQLTDVKALEKKTGQKVVLMDGDEFDDFEEYKKAKTAGVDQIAHVGHTENSSSWVPERTVDEIEVNIRDVSPQARIESQPSTPTEKSQGNVPQMPLFLADEQDGYIKKVLHQDDKNNIGDWGEKYVYKYLKSEYWNQSSKETNNGFIADDGNSKIEIKWLNQNGNFGRGCDFEVWRDGELVEQIEVKSTIETQSALIELSRLQWETAKNLHIRKNGEKYSIYVVIGAGTDLSILMKFNDPISRWFADDLITQAVELRVQP